MSRDFYSQVVQKFVLLKADALSNVLFDALSDVDGCAEDADGDARQTARWTDSQTRHSCCIFMHVVP